MLERFDETVVAAAQAHLVEGLSEVLCLSAEEYELAQQALPLTWGAFGYSTLSDESFTRPGETEGWVVRPEAMSFFAGEPPRPDRPVLDFRTGALAKKMDYLYHGDEQDQARFAQASKLLGSFLFTLGMSCDFTHDTGHRFVQSIPQSLLYSTGFDSVGLVFNMVNRPPINFHGPLRNVVTYGPGMTGGILYRSLLGNLRNMHFVSGGQGAHFVNEFIRSDCANSDNDMAELRAAVTARNIGPPEGMLPQGMTPHDMVPAETHFYTDGIAASTAHFGNHDVVDAVIMSAVHRAGVDECVAGIEFAAEHLRPDGVLIMKAPDVSVGDEAGLDRVVPHAVRAFGSAAITGACGELMRFNDPEPPRSRSASFAVFRR